MIHWNSRIFHFWNCISVLSKPVCFILEFINLSCFYFISSLYNDLHYIFKENNMKLAFHYFKFLEDLNLLCSTSNDTYSWSSAEGPTELCISVVCPGDNANIHYHHKYLGKHLFKTVNELRPDLGLQILRGDIFFFYLPQI